MDYEHVVSFAVHPGMPTAVAGKVLKWFGPWNVEEHVRAMTVCMCLVKVL